MNCSTSAPSGRTTNLCGLLKANTEATNELDPIQHSWTQSQCYIPLLHYLLYLLTAALLLPRYMFYDCTNTWPAKALLMEATEYPESQGWRQVSVRRTWEENPNPPSWKCSKSPFPYLHCWPSCPAACPALAVLGAQFQQPGAGCSFPQGTQFPRHALRHAPCQDQQ